MNQKLVARSVVFLLAFVGCLKLLEVSNLVAVSIDTQVTAGNIKVESAPQVANLFEKVLAAVIALFITTGRVGDWATAGLIKLWNVLVARVSNTIASEVNSDSLDEVLTEHDMRIATVEKILDSGDPLYRALEDRVGKLENRLASVEAVLADLQTKHNSLVARTQPHKNEIAELRGVQTSLEARTTAVESALQAVSQSAAPRAARTTRKKAGA